MWCRQCAARARRAIIPAVDYCNRHAAPRIETTSRLAVRDRTTNLNEIVTMLRCTIFLYFVYLSRQNVINTAQGTVKGVIDDGFISYNAIPYGTVTDNAARFKQAGLAPLWTGPLEAHRSDCSSRSVEECLQLDVHVPAAGGAPWPVLVWLAGAGAGAARYHPAHLTRQHVIVVVVHHRIGPLGFLCTEEEAIPGNAGVKDVVAALRWVRDNIIAFRGNPANVVVGGQGYAAAMVEGLLLSPMAEGLFHGAIMQSGSILSPWAFNYDARDRARALEEMIDSDTDAPALLKASVADLVTDSENLNLPYFPYGMCVENAFKKAEQFLSEPPFELLTKRKLRRVPMIIGFNSDEGYILASMLKKAGVLRRISKDIRSILPDEMQGINEGDIQQIKDMYFSKRINMTSVLAFHRDAYFMNHVHRSARLHATASERPVYYYRLSHTPAAGVQPERGAGRKSGAAHSDDLALLFPPPGQDLDDDDAAVQRTILQLWTNFVKYLNPTPHGSDPGLPLWEPLEARAPRLLELSAAPGMSGFPHARAAQLWDRLYEAHYYSQKHTPR